MKVEVTSLAAAFFLLGDIAHAFYLPGVNPKSFAEGDV